MDPTSVERLFSLLAGVVDVMTAIAALLLVVVLTARLRTSSGMSSVTRLEEKRRLFGLRYSTNARLNASEVPPARSSSAEPTHHLFVHPSRLSQK